MFDSRQAPGVRLSDGEVILSAGIREVRPSSDGPRSVQPGTCRRLSGASGTAPVCVLATRVAPRAGPGKEYRHGPAATVLLNRLEPS